jgi:hypothetical protein
VTRISGHMRCIRDGDERIVGYHLRVARDNVVFADETLDRCDYWLHARPRFRELIDAARGGPEPYLPPVTPPPTL